MEDCLHNGPFEFVSYVVRGDMPDGMPRWIMTAELKCGTCGMPFKFAGLSEGVFIIGPGRDAAGLVAHLAVYPENMEMPFAEH